MNLAKKARIYVVDEQSLKTNIGDGIISIRVPDLGAQWLKTVSDIMADMLQTEIGDYAFLWEQKSENGKNKIHGVYRIISKPYYDNTDANAPFKIHIEPAFIFANPIYEYELLNNPYIEDKLWNIIGKKIAGKARGSSPLSFSETQHIFDMLLGKNKNYSFIPEDAKRIIPVKKPLQINLSNTGINAFPKGWGNFHPNDLFFLNNNNELYYEKTLEALLNQEISNKNNTLFECLGINVSNIIWYGNYLPYSIERSEIDYIIIESEDGFFTNKIYVIELMKTEIDEDHIERIKEYSKWIKNVLASGEGKVIPLIICSKSYNFIDETPLRNRRSEEKRIRIKNSLVDQKYHELENIQVFTYNCNYSKLSFEKKS